MTFEVAVDDAITCLNQVPAPRGGRKTCGTQVPISQAGQCPCCQGMVW